MSATESLEGRAYIVTGASRGIGLEAAKALARRGSHVAIFGRNAAPLEAAAEAIGTGTLSVPVDVGDRAAVHAAVARVRDRFGRLDGIINNAGAAIVSRIEFITDETLMAQINVNLIGIVYCCQAVIPHLRAQGGGRIVNVTSEAAHRSCPFPHLSIYAATKAAAERFTEDLREEVKKDNIGVTTFAPGSTATDFGAEQNWNVEEVRAAYDAWTATGGVDDGIMQSDAVGEAIVRCLELPMGSAFDFVEMRPNRPSTKTLRVSME